jgi:chromosome segregation ATPase
MGKMNHTKAVRERHKAARRIAELEQLLANAEARIRAECRGEIEAIQSNLADVAAQLLVEREHHAETAALLRKERADRRAQAERHQAALDVKEAQLAALRSDRDRWQSEADAARPAVDEAQRSVRDLQKLLDKVRDRMSRKERETEQAILNRKALAKALFIPAEETES